MGWEGWAVKYRHMDHDEYILTKGSYTFEWIQKQKKKNWNYIIFFIKGNLY